MGERAEELHGTGRRQPGKQHQQEGSATSRAEGMGEDGIIRVQKLSHMTGSRTTMER